MRILVALILACAPALAQKAAWHTDLTTAREEARERKKPLFVVVHQPGERDNDQMHKSVYRHSRFKSASSAYVRLVLCQGAEDAIAGTLKDFGIRDATGARNFERTARRALFGNVPIATPQFLVFHPDGDLLWHHIRVCSQDVLAKGLGEARRNLHIKLDKRLELATQRAAKLAEAAERSGDHYAMLLACIRHAPGGRIWDVAGDLAQRPALAERIVADLRKIVGAGPFEAIAKRAPANWRPFTQKVAKGAGNGDGVPLRELGKLEAPDRLTFAKEREFLRHKPTVIWLFLPGDRSVKRQIVALKTAKEELAKIAPDAEMIALGASIDLDKDLEAIGKLGFPCPVGVYRYDSRMPYAEVNMFPCALVVTESGELVYRTSDDKRAMRASYTHFLGAVRTMISEGR